MSLGLSVWCWYARTQGRMWGEQKLSHFTYKMRYLALCYLITASFGFDFQQLDTFNPKSVTRREKQHPKESTHRPACSKDLINYVVVFLAPHVKNVSKNPGVIFAGNLNWNGQIGFPGPCTMSPGYICSDRFPSLLFLQLVRRVFGGCRTSAVKSVATPADMLECFWNKASGVRRLYIYLFTFKN